MAGAGKTHTMMGSERVVGARSEGGSEEVSGIVPQSLVELFHQLEERVVAGSGDEDETESWAVRVGYLQVCGRVMRFWVGPNTYVTLPVTFFLCKIQLERKVGEVRVCAQPERTATQGQDRVYTSDHTVLRTYWIVL